MTDENYLEKKILTMGEASLFTGMSRSTLYKLTMNRIVPFSKPRGKLIFFRRTDLEDFLLSNAHKSKSQLAVEAEKFLKRKRTRQSNLEL